MNSKQAKRLRRAIIADVYYVGHSKGHIMRKLTRYDEKQLNPQKPFNTLLVKKDTPRGVYRHLKKRIRRGEIKLSDLKQRVTQADAPV